MPNTDRYYRARFDHGEVTVTLPEKLSIEDVKDLEEYFALLLKEAKRRVGQLGVSTNV